MFLAVREIMHSKTKFSMIIVIFVLLAWLVFILSGLGNGLSTLAAAVFKIWMPTMSSSRKTPARR